MTSFLILTAFTVSIDSFICGFSLSFINKRKFPLILGIALTVFIMCAAVNYLTFFFRDILSEKTACIGGLILILIGTYNLLKNLRRKRQNTAQRQNSFLLTLLTGFAVGIDGALANFSLALMSINQFYVPIVIAVMHAIMIWLGIILSNTAIALKLGKIELFSPILLIFLGVYKMFGLFI